MMSGCSSTFGSKEDVSAGDHSGSDDTHAEMITDEELLENVERERAVNPWGETQSSSVVSEWTGIDFIPPADEITLENGRLISLTTYRYMTRIAESLYKADDYELTVRQSRDLQGAELSGDNNTYSSEWSEEINGYTVQCLGNGDGILAAYYDASGYHFSVTYHCGEDNEGLTSADLYRILGSDIRRTPD
ncbi:MAG: hypothetical protein K5886_03760 [Lachnospiraceae bacterium]|nr:hypothetical protein [Lachnospiraceae bacterium]